MADVRFIRESLHLQYSACPLSAKSGHRQLGKIVSKTRLRVETSGYLIMSATTFCGLTTTIWFSVMKNLYVFSFDTFSTTKGGKARVCSVFRSCNELDVRSQALTLKREAMASLKTVAAPAKAPCHNSQASTLTHVSQTNSLVI